LSDGKQPSSTPRRWPILTLIIAGLVLVADQVSKSFAEAHLGLAPEHVFGPFGLALTYNTGSSFSLLQGSSIPLMVLDVILVIVLLVVARRTESMGIRVGLGLMMGGALGNLADRLARHHDRGVVDFITLSHWPTFNLADSAITLGTLVIIISVLVDMARHRQEQDVS